MPGVASQLGSAVSPGDLAELMSAFNEVTTRLQSTHESLHREVVRLKAELQEANEQLQRSKRLAALGEMAAGIAHEVRNPLGSIRLYAQMLEQDLSDRPAPQKIAKKIAAAVHGLNAVVNDVLDFSRDLKADVAPVRAAEVVSGALDACGVSETMARRLGGAAEDSDQEVWCDSALMHQALVNIIRNALEAMAEHQARAGGHRLSIEVSDVDDSTQAIRVLDTGPGIPQDTIDRMFNPFFTTRKTGTGLGLAIVHRIIDAHGGRISVRNALDGGAEFELLIPRRACEARSSEVVRVITPARNVRRRRAQEMHG